jgi:hypothetical protein
MASSRFLVAFAVVAAFLGLAYLWTRPGTRIDQTIVIGDPAAPLRSADAATPRRLKP